MKRGRTDYLPEFVSRKAELRRDLEDEAEERAARREQARGERVEGVALGERERPLVRRRLPRVHRRALQLRVGQVFRRKLPVPRARGGYGVRDAACPISTG